MLHITFCLAFLSCANHALCPRHGQCLPPSSCCCCCCCCFRPCTGSDTRTGVWARKRVLYLSYLPFSPHFLLLLLFLCRFFGCDTRFNSSCSACSTWQWICHKNCNDYVANVPYKSCWARGSGVCVWQVWHGCIYINVLCLMFVCVFCVAAPS